SAGVSRKRQCASQLLHVGQRIGSSGVFLAVIRATPLIWHVAAAILPCLGYGPMTRQHGIDTASQFQITFKDRTAKLFVSVLGPKRLELVMKIEDHGWIGEAPSGTACMRVQPNHKEGLTTETE